MARPASTHPTERELEILQVLWEIGPCTSHEITAILNKRRKTAHTTVFTILQIMIDKGFAEKDESQRSHIYSAVETKEKVQATIIEDVLKRVFQDSPTDLFLRALAARPTSAEEFAEIRELLNDMEKQQ